MCALARVLLNVPGFGCTSSVSASLEYDQLLGIFRAGAIGVTQQSRDIMP